MNEDRFVELWQRAGGSAGAARQVHTDLIARYGAPGRHYHGPRHIAHCLRRVDETRAHLASPDTVEMALWFHDAVYDVKRKDNERRSAALFLALAGETLPLRFRQSVSALILMTVHPSAPRSNDQRFVVDIDLASFALPWPEFLRDSRDVRAEHMHLSDQMFASGQGAFLGRLVGGEHFYHSTYFQRRHERQACANIRRYLDLMAPPAPRPVMSLAASA